MLWHPGILFLLSWHHCLVSSLILISIIIDRRKLGTRCCGILGYYFCCHGIIVWSLAQYLPVLSQTEGSWAPDTVASWDIISVVMASVSGFQPMARACNNSLSTITLWLLFTTENNITALQLNGAWFKKRYYVDLCYRML